MAKESLGNVTLLNLIQFDLKFMNISCSLTLSIHGLKGLKNTFINGENGLHVEKSLIWEIR